MTDEELCWTVVEPVWPDSEVGDELAQIQTITPGQRALYVTMLYAREVDNGGIRQFLSNSSSMYYRYVLEGLDLLGAGDLREPLKTFLGFLPDGRPSPDWGERRRSVAGLSPQQRELIQAHEDAVYRSGGFEKSLLPSWARYIQQHPDDFFLAPC